MLNRGLLKIYRFDFQSKNVLRCPLLSYTLMRFLESESLRPLVEFCIALFFLISIQFFYFSTNILLKSHSNLQIFENITGFTNSSQFSKMVNFQFSFSLQFQIFSMVSYSEPTVWLFTLLLIHTEWMLLNTDIERNVITTQGLKCI